jgi:eukaryotic-like serine/threonine-protein kinase
MGTAGYMSPEHARGLVVDHRGDIFALGAILFEMLTGRRAFQGGTIADTIAAIVRDDPPDVQQLNASVPPSLASVVRRCLAKNPATRVQTADELVLALDAIPGIAPRAAASAPRDKGIVVLPFDSMSADPDNVFFADGLTEEIISDLSKVSGLRVISRTSAMQLKGRKGNLKEVVRELDVQYVLEGSVRRAADRLRISAQLIDALADANLWSEKFSGTVEDVFDIQERVARAIASELSVKLTRDDSSAIGRRRIADPAAYECYLRARADVLNFTDEGLRRAQREIDQGLQLAGENVLLLSVKGEAAWQLFNLGIVTDRAQLDVVRGIARRIEALEPGSFHADRLWGLVACNSGHPVHAAQRLRKAITGDPGDTLAMGIYVFCCIILGRVDLARPVAQRVVEINPLDELAVGMSGWMEFMDGNFEMAVRIFGRAHSTSPLNAPLAAMYVQTLAAAGRVAESLAVADAIARNRPDDMWTWFAQAFASALRGEGGALAASTTAERKAWASADPQYCLMLAECYALTDRADDAFEWLESLVRTSALPYPFLSSIDPFLTKLRTDPRWDPFISRMRAEWEESGIADSGH